MTYQEWAGWKTQNTDTKDEKRGIIDVDEMHPKNLGGVERKVESMTFEEADTFSTNPHYEESYGYKINCQSCVVANEARRRGYDVATRPNTRGSVCEKLSRQTNLAWIDKSTGKPPTYIKDETATTPKKMLAFIKNTLQPGARYTIEFGWKGRGNSGHIINIDLDPNGEVRMHDNQRGKGERAEWLGDSAVLSYLQQVKYQVSVYGYKLYAGPKLLRIDDKMFNEAIVNQILEESP